MHRKAKSRAGPASFLFAIVWTALVALKVCVAAESQTPLGLNAVSELNWKRCGEISNHTVECARLDVPMDHFGNAASKTFSIALIRMLATNASARSIILNPGGPGASGVNLLWRMGAALNKLMGEDFHLLSFDPRGVNRSTPQASCYPNNALRAQAFKSNPWDLEFQAGEMFTKAENKVKACEDTIGEHGRYINTPQTAADMDSILDAIGQEKMYYWGFSCKSFYYMFLKTDLTRTDGTTLGQTYAQLFPERVSRLVIDGVSNLDEWYNAFFFDESLIDTDRIFAGFVDECFKAKDACPLNSIREKPFKSSSELKSYIDDFLEKLNEEPIPVYLNNSNYGEVSRRNVVTNGIFFALYKPTPTWPLLASNLAELINGNATPAYNAYSDSWIVSVLTDDTNTFIVLNDNWKTGREAPLHGIQPIRTHLLSRPEISKLVSKYRGSDIYDRASWSIPTTHNFYPRYYPEFPRVKTAEPILVLSTTYDPVCPLISAKKAYNSFEGAALVEQKSYGHCSISMPSLCTMKHVQRYFNDGVLPKAGATCEIDAEYFPASEKSPMPALSAKDEALLTALRELASLYFFDS